MTDRSPSQPGSVDEVEYCYGHPDTETRLHCTRCGKPICGRCAVPASVGQHCVWCVAEAKKSAPKVKSTMAAVSPVVMGLIVVNVAIWLAQSALSVTAPAGEADWLTFHFAMIPGAIASGEWYRLLTPMFLHAPFTGAITGLIHVGFNMYILRIYGPNVEEAFGSVQFLGMYLLAGFAGSATSYGFGSVMRASLGASGAVFGVVGMLLVFLHRRRNRAMVAQYQRTLLVFVGLNLLIGFTFPRIDNLAHIGGLLGGAALGLGFDAGDGVPVSAARRIATFAAVGGTALAIVLWRTSALTA